MLHQGASGPTGASFYIFPLKSLHSIKSLLSLDGVYQHFDGYWPSLNKPASLQKCLVDHSSSSRDHSEYRDLTQHVHPGAWP